MPPEVSDVPALLPMEEACRRLGGVSRSTIYRLSRRGKLRLCHVLGRTLVPRSELDRYLAEILQTLDVQPGSEAA